MPKGLLDCRLLVIGARVRSFFTLPVGCATRIQSAEFLHVGYPACLDREALVDLHPFLYLFVCSHIPYSYSRRAAILALATVL